MHLTTQATISLINNKGDVEATLKELGSKENIKQLAFAMASAGISHKIDKGLGLKGLDITQTGFDQRMVKAIADSTSTSLLQTAVYGSDFEENLKKNLRMQFATVATQETFSNIVKDLDSDTLSDNIAHKIAAGLTGCLSAKASGNACDAGAIGAVVGEMWGDWHTDNPNTLTPAQKEKLINQAKLLAGITAAYAGEDVNVAADMAAEAVRWNATGNKYQLQRLKYDSLYGSSITNIQEQLLIGKLILNKELADWIYMLNTDENLIVEMPLHRPITVVIDKDDNWKPNPSYPQEEFKSASVSYINFQEWGVLGHVSVSRNKYSQSGYRVINDEYDFAMQKGIQSTPRNIETFLGRPSGTGVKYRIKITNQHLIRFTHE